MGAKEFFGHDIAEMFNNSAGTGPLPERLWSGFELHENDLVLEVGCQRVLSRPLRAAGETRGAFDHYCERKR